MSTSPQPDKLAVSVAEEVLRIIYGDDYQDCRVNPATISAVVQEGFNQHAIQTQQLLALYEKVVEAIHTLSTPPDLTAVKNPDELRNLLSQRLDGIHAITAKTQDTTALIHKQLETE